MRRRRMRAWSALAASAVTAAAMLLTAPGTAHADTSPPGANDWTCKPTPQRPRPVVLVHGTFENMAFNWQWLSPVLKRHGYCVFALNYGGKTPESPIQGTEDIPTSAGQLAAFVDAVLKATGAAEVDIIGHSQGGMMPRYYVRFLGGADKVHHLIGLAPSNYGTTFWGLVVEGGLMRLTELAVRLAPAVGQQIEGSQFLRKLNDGGDTVPGVVYTVIASRYDEVVTPYTNSFLKDGRARNLTIQDLCPLNPVEHLAIIWDKPTQLVILNTLAGLDPRTPVECAFPRP